MKSKQADLVEAYSARKSNQVAMKQNQRVLIFTLFTIFFLPLSFFTSLFGMNVRDWSDDPSNKTLRSVITLTGSISAVIIIIAIVFAFGPPPLAAALQAKEKIKDSYPILKQKLKRGQKDHKRGEEDEDDQRPVRVESTLTDKTEQPKRSFQERLSAAFLPTHKRHDSAISGTGTRPQS
jgi:hypothetical protein